MSDENTRRTFGVIAVVNDDGNDGVTVVAQTEAENVHHALAMRDRWRKAMNDLGWQHVMVDAIETTEPWDADTLYDVIEHIPEVPHWHIFGCDGASLPDYDEVFVGEHDDLLAAIEDAARSYYGQEGVAEQIADGVWTSRRSATSKGGYTFFAESCSNVDCIADA